ncbi:MoaD/ThiS family protein [Pedobacter sp. MW01-1-1]|uniref:MoaD/ThiS family protein n=1 Tax=Pedobacter sp. MW01-1-1 TaxID=3383027 RepID=UPI003FF055FB
MNIKVYAVLKDYFDQEFTLDKQVGTISELKEVLIGINPSAVKVLNLSRFAINNTFINSDFKFTGNEHISIIPPSSGG